MKRTVIVSFKDNVLLFTVLAGVAFSVLLSIAVSAGNLDAGKQKAKSCAVCHGVDGISKKPDTPSIAGQPEYYLRTQLIDYRSGKRFHQQMNIVAQPLSDEDIDDLSVWYSSIKLKVEMPD